MNRVCNLVASATPLPVSAADRRFAQLVRAQDLLIRFFDVAATWQERSAGRRRLGELDDRMLRDAGIDQAAAATEVGKTFWQA
jgi:uncharacterized protein YjiS (DUF1127 family)